MRSTFRKGLLASVTALAVSALLATSTAAADPGFVPDADDAVGTGSDTTELVLNALATSYNATSPTVRLASWDAPTLGQPNPPIVLRSGTTAIPRPNGSGAGITELKRSGTPTNFARSSRARQATDGATVIFLPFAKDVINYAVANTTNAALNLTAAELKTIFECTATTWSAVRTGLPATTIAPVLPQAGSGTRTTFLASIGNAVPGSCVVEVQENDPTPISGNPNRIGPFSAGRFAVLPTPKPIQLNTGGYSGPRKLYNVVIDTNGGGVLNGGTAAALQPIFGTGNPTAAGVGAGWICGSAATSVISGQGFTQLTAVEKCGKAE
ncbi:substrate-binding domain-containing protein [Actinokineospora sp. NBRC 105648]|uniref:PstS family phosphate ABC transporter substrate-binding protein n=1 Tax=Actinokineospora sp. NBRC 105648 TaxID=3032206 RepID=UPI0024A201E0|nr:substrate-binding domain-containing protein [Actinokineospora sp. NBRC 105648]GLZ43064.1 hypothetical protein Acsp05_66880 [Actinokineospora sp. NBRC 105648]